jgi:hypothetical protein
LKDCVDVTGVVGVLYTDFALVEKGGKFIGGVLTLRRFSVVGCG